MENAKGSNNHSNREEDEGIENPTSRNDTQIGVNPVAVTENGESNPNPVEGEEGESRGRQAVNSRRTPFTDLSQVDADLALARTLQEQERAYMMLRMNADGSDYGSWEAWSYGQEDEDDDDFDNPSEEDYDHSDLDEDEGEEEEEGEDAFDANARAERSEDENQGIDLDPSAFPSDEAYARALQEAEERQMAARLLAIAGINELYVGEAQDEDDPRDNSQEAWEEVDPDELSYEELLALGEVVGTESRGLSTDKIASLPSVNYDPKDAQGENNDSCVICRFDYEDGDTLTVLSCKHKYHSECIHNWLLINKVCPVCSAEVSTSGS